MWCVGKQRCAIGHANARWCPGVYTRILSNAAPARTVDEFVVLGEGDAVIGGIDCHPSLPVVAVSGFNGHRGLVIEVCIRVCRCRQRGKCWYIALKRPRCLRGLGSVIGGCEAGAAAGLRAGTGSFCENYLIIN